MKYNKVQRGTSALIEIAVAVLSGLVSGAAIIFAVGVGGLFLVNKLTDDQAPVWIENSSMILAFFVGCYAGGWVTNRIRKEWDGAGTLCLLLLTALGILVLNAHNIRVIDVLLFLSILTTLLPAIRYRRRIRRAAKQQRELEAMLLVPEQVNAVS